MNEVGIKLAVLFGSVFVGLSIGHFINYFIHLRKFHKKDVIKNLENQIDKLKK